MYIKHLAILEGVKLRLAIVTFNFDPNRPGGVNSVVIQLLQMIRGFIPAKLDIFSFSNVSYDSNSISLFRPKSYRNTLVVADGMFQDSKIIRVGSIGSELEFLRYRKRNELKNFFESYSAIIVVTGIIQFANVIPKLQIPVIVQCATRLPWERQSQYPSMKRGKRVILKIQRPVLAIQEFRVLRSQAIFLVENSRMKKWIESKAFQTPEVWYPGVKTSAEKLPPGNSPSIKGHFVSVGRLNDSRKGWERLFLAYKESFDLNPKLPGLVVIGGGEFLEKTQELVDKIIVSYPVTILKNASNLERDRVMSSASYFLQTSYEEGLGLAALEALSFGVPLICSDTDGSREYVVEGRSGTLIPQGEHFVKDFGKAIASSQSWNYEALHVSSKELFGSKFSQEVSLQRLRIILKNVGVC